MIRVLIVEDSPSVSQLLVRLFESDGNFQVLGVADDGEKAVAMAARLRPDVITMDIHLPRLNGVAATRQIMVETPTPVVVVTSSVQAAEVGLAFEALRAGAVSVLEKPPGPGHPEHARATQDLLNTVRLMAEVKVVRRQRAHGADEPFSPRAAHPGNARPSIIAIAASTGGPHAIQTVLQGLGRDLPVPVVVVQHIAVGFAGGMASWLSSTCPMPVQVASQGEEPQAGLVYLAPDDRHLMLSRRRALVVSAAPAVNGFRPSANVLFESVAESYGRDAIGVILTGMGDDGVDGLAMLRAGGASTIAQDAETSVVHGMPGAAIARGAADQVLPLPAIAPTLRAVLGSGVRSG